MNQAMENGHLFEFQFLLVRLRAETLEMLIKILAEFQFLLVRLRALMTTKNKAENQPKNTK